jgi:CBS domain-containing protein
VLLGSVAHTALGLDPQTPVERVMNPAPGTIRPDERVDDVMQQIDKDHLDHVYVTTADGVLVGIVLRGETHV